MKAEPQDQSEQLNRQPNVDLKAVCRSLLQIIARFEEKSYTGENIRQTVEVVLDDQANPASETSTTQG